MPDTIERHVLRYYIWEAREFAPFTRLVDMETIRPWRGVEARRSLFKHFQRRALVKPKQRYQPKEPSDH